MKTLYTHEITSHQQNKISIGRYNFDVFHAVHIFLVYLCRNKTVKSGGFDVSAMLADAEEV